MSAINPTKITATNCSACAWITKTAHSARVTLAMGASKVSTIASVSFRSLAQYASMTSSYLKNGAILGVKLAKANPQVATGSAALLALATAAYVYRSHIARS